MDRFLIEFGSNVARARKRAGLTQEALRELTEIDKSEISKIENGWINVTIKRVELLAKVLGVTPGQLLDGGFG